MLNDLVSTRPEGDDLFDPRLCGIQVRRSLQPNHGPIIFSSEDIVLGRFHGLPSVGLRLFSEFSDERFECLKYR
jgi:hypothetical protein